MAVYAAWKMVPGISDEWLWVGFIFLKRSGFKYLIFISKKPVLRMFFSKSAMFSFKTGSDFYVTLMTDPTYKHIFCGKEEVF